MRISLRWVGLFVVALPIVGCECETPVDPDAGAIPDAYMPPGTDADLDAFRPARDSGVDAASVTFECGDGVVDGDEMCDDDGTAPGDGCDADCQIETGYSCMGEPSVCTTGCGDGTISDTEACDDGGDEAGDGCSATCQIEAGWACPPGEPTTGCTSDCGDGVEAVGIEECDDGNLTDGDGCDDGIGPDDGAGPQWLPACLDTRCGNGIPTTGEACDDGNTSDGDGCSAMCAIE
ncbi:MAG: DUF4215 domain-containing protein [Deltaproteobacteria bacterium]|nr:DUF4215 domain-containing protein [Deltaproteobacteria bacterium]